MNTLSTINNPLGGSSGAGGERQRPGVTGGVFLVVCKGAHSINGFSSSLHKVPFKIMSFSFLKYTFVTVNLHPVLLNKWYSV